MRPAIRSEYVRSNAPTARHRGPRLCPFGLQHGARRWVERRGHPLRRRLQAGHVYGPLCVHHLAELADPALWQRPNHRYARTLGRPHPGADARRFAVEHEQRGPTSPAIELAASPSNSRSRSLSPGLAGSHPRTRAKLSTGPPHAGRLVRIDAAVAAELNQDTSCVQHHPVGDDASTDGHVSATSRQRSSA